MASELVVDIKSFWTWYYNGILSRKDREKDPEEILFDKIPAQIILPNLTSQIGRRIKDTEQLVKNNEVLRKMEQELVNEDGTISLQAPPIIIVPSDTKESVLLRLQNRISGLTAALSVFTVYHIVAMSVYSRNVTLVAFQVLFLLMHALGAYGVFKKNVAQLTISSYFTQIQAIYFTLLMAKPIDVIIGFLAFVFVFQLNKFKQKLLITWFSPATI